MNFTVHGVGKSQRKLDIGEDKVWLSVPAFESAMSVIHGRDDVCLTVDDGNCSDVEIVLPTLLKLGMKAIFFISTGLLGSCGYMSHNSVRCLAQSGMVLGSHGTCHSNWRNLSDEQLTEEIHKSRDILQQITGAAVTDAACPFGAYDSRVLLCLRRMGFRRVYTSDRGLARANAWLQPRNSLYSNDTPESVRQIMNQNPFGAKSLICVLKTTIKRYR